MHFPKMRARPQDFPFVNSVSSEIFQTVYRSCRILPEPNLPTGSRVGSVSTLGWSIENSIRFDTKRVGVLGLVASINRALVMDEYRS